MCEFNIKRIDAVNLDADKDRRGCYKRGDIISVDEDNAYINMPHLTVLAVPGLSASKVNKLMEMRMKPVDTQVSLFEEEYQQIKDNVDVITYNDKEYTIYMGKYINPKQISNENGVRTFTAKELVPVQRRRFKVPDNLMNALFSDNVLRREISKATFLNHLDNILDKTFGINISETTWRQAFIETL